MTDIIEVQDPWAQTIIWGPQEILHREEPPGELLGERVRVRTAEEIHRDGWYGVEAYRGGKSDHNVPEEEWHPMSRYGKAAGDVGLEMRHCPGCVIGSVRIFGWIDVRGEPELHYSEGTLGKMLRSEEESLDRITSNPWWFGPDSPFGTGIGWLLGQPVVNSALSFERTDVTQKVI